MQGYVEQQRQVTISAPNTLLHPEGVGLEKWLSPIAVIPYTIRFSNNAAQGTTPVAKVSITQQLDSDLDLNTFSLSSFGFGNVTVDVPVGAQNFSQRLDLRNTRGVFVDVNAGLNTTTGIVTWTLTAINPITGNPTDVTSEGFLPPNDDNGTGRGFAGYSVQSKNSAVTNSRINAQAAITFNNQPAILTDAIFNTLDKDSPVSQINPLSSSSSPNFLVSWSGGDSGSGIAAYDIYVSVNNGQYVLWQTNTTGTSANYTGVIGSTYSFYSIAKDNVGNAEAISLSADAQTSIEGQNLTIYGGVGNDTINGGNGNDTLNGGLGNDYLSGGLGNDILDGSVDRTGLDTFAGGAGDDIYGIYNSATIIVENAGEGNDSVWTDVNYALPANVESMYLVGSISGIGNDGDNAITGYGAGNNTIYGLGGNDALYGGEGNDFLNGGLGNDYLSGGLGNDILDGSVDRTGLDTFAGGAGDDIYGIYNSATIIVENAGEGNDSVWTDVNYALSVNIESMYLVGSISGIGNDGDNAITGYGAGDNNIYGLGGNDALYSGDGNDTLYGGNGADYLNGALGNDVLDGENGNDILYGEQGADSLYGANGDDTIFGGSDNDVLNGGDGNDVLDGENGNDILYGEQGADSLYGANGDDTIFGGSDNDVLRGGDGNDVLDGENGNDILYGEQGADSLYGADGDDTIFGDSDNDFLSGGLGNDVLDGENGNDILYGEQGDDRLYGANGDDYLNGGEGNDYLDGGDGNDILDGSGDGIELDTFAGGDGNDVYGIYNSATVIVENAGEGVDTVWTEVDCMLTANIENMYLVGNITGTGNEDNNIIISYGAGTHSIYGLSGNDTLASGYGTDNLYGGTGNDTFVLNKTGIANIGDFGMGSDAIQISASVFGGGLTANAALLSTQIRIGANSANTIDQRFIYDTNNGDLLFDADGSANSSVAVKIANLSGAQLGVSSFSIV